MCQTKLFQQWVSAEHPHTFSAVSGHSLKSCVSHRVFPQVNMDLHVSKILFFQVLLSWILYWFWLVRDWKINNKGAEEGEQKSERDDATLTGAQPLLFKGYELKNKLRYSGTFQSREDFNMQTNVFSTESVSNISSLDFDSYMRKSMKRYIIG